MQQGDYLLFQISVPAEGKGGLMTFQRSRRSGAGPLPRALPHISAQPPPLPLPRLLSHVLFFSARLTLTPPFLDCHSLTLLLLFCSIYYLLRSCTYLTVFTLTVVSLFLLEYKLCESGDLCFVPSASQGIESAWCIVGAQQMFVEWR